MQYKVISVGADNLQDHPQVICFINPKHPSYPRKIHWLKERFSEGMVIKLLYVDGEKRPVGFIEYVPGDKCWRAVNAPEHLFVHCIWINAVKYKNRGFGSVLLQECLADAENGGFAGVAALTSSGAFMADRSLFERNGFVSAGSDPPFDLMVRNLKEAPAPSFNDWRGELLTYRGLHIVYSAQCPWVARFVDEVKAMLNELEIEITTTELKTALEAQHAPSPYSVFNLVYNGRLLADHYISSTRLMNILKKEKLVGVKA